LGAEVEENRLEHAEVDSLGATEGRELEPDDKHRLEGEVPGNVVEDDWEGEGLEEVEEAEDDPVREPLDVVMRRRRLDGLEGEICGKAPSDEI